MKATTEPGFTVTVERPHFRTLIVRYEEKGRELNALFEEAAKAEGLWIAVSDLVYWRSGHPITEEERDEIFERLNAWGQSHSLRFSLGLKLSEVKLVNLPPEQRQALWYFREVVSQQQQKNNRLTKPKNSRWKRFLG